MSNHITKATRNRPENNKEETGGKRKKIYTAPALEKGLDIIEALAEESGGLTSSEIAKRLKRPMGQLFRMLVVLQQRDYVVYRPDSECYELTLSIFKLSQKLSPIRRLTSAASTPMRDLAREIEQSCHLVIYYAGKGHVVVQQDSPSERVLTVKLGAEAPLLESCSGRVLLAFTDEEERQEMLNKIPGHKETLKKKDFIQTIDRIRSSGYESSPSLQIQGVQDIGYPVFDHLDRIAGALVVPFLSYLDGSHPVELSVAKDSIAKTADIISSRLGNSYRSSNSV